MSAAQYFDIYTDYKPVAGNVVAPLFPIVRQSPEQQRTVSLGLDTVMFTGRVPLSTWTFTIAIADKLWVSDRISLYFGKEVPVRRFIYQDDMLVNQHRINLDISVAAYNNYGDVLKASRNMRFYDAGDGVKPHGLFQVEDNWMQLLFKFKLSFKDSQ